MTENNSENTNQEYSISLAKNYFNETEESMQSRGKIPELGISSMPELNEIMCGLPKNNLTVIGARTSMGKTSFAIQLMIDLLRNDKSVMYMGFEMSQTELIERVFCNMYKIDNRKLLFGGFDEFATKWEDFKIKTENAKFVIGDKFGTNWKQLSDFLNELTKMPDVIVIDYIQAISQGQGEGKSFIDDYILNFRNLSIEKGFAGVMVSQLNRASQDRKDTSPQLHDLKGSGYLEELADLCLLLNWTGRGKDDESKNDFEVNIAKNRRGPTGYKKVKYYPEHYLFTDWNADLNEATQEILDMSFDEN